MTIQTRPVTRYPFARFLNARAAQAPAFTHDDRSVLFVSDITGVPQLWRVPVDGGWPDQLRPRRSGPALRRADVRIQVLQVARRHRGDRPRDTRVLGGPRL